MNSAKSFSLIPCESPLWAPDRHTQTILGDILPSASLQDRGQLWTIELPDHDKIICRVFEQTSDWVITLHHGLTGSADAKYMHRAAREFLQLGYSVVLMNHRNCGEGKGLAKHPYHSGKSDDLGFVIARVRERFPRKKVLSIGFSMSANALLLLMSRVVPSAQIFNPEQFEDRKSELGLDRPDLALTVNAPINLEKASSMISQSWNRIYELSFMANLHFLIKDLEKKKILSPAEGLHPLMKVSYFDDRFTAPRSGFESGLHYYQTCSAQKHLHKIDRPTVCLTSQTDPFVDYKDYLEADLSPMTRIHIEEVGGHMGYLHKEKTPLGSFRWLDYGVLEISKKIISES